MTRVPQLGYFLLSIFFITHFTWAVSPADVPRPGVILPIPSPAEHAAFLLQPWRAEAPVVIIFSDPFCPYCIQALESREALASYNAFLFWYPIFGESSETRVAEILRCGAPVGSKVIDAVIEGVSPQCAAAKNAQQFTLNQKMYQAYAPPGVPAYYLGGVKVTLAELTAWRQTLTAIKSSVQLDWPRYRLNRLTAPTGDLAKVVLLLPPHYAKTTALIPVLKTARRYEWYLMVDGEGAHYKTLCQYLVGQCAAPMLTLYAGATQEMKLLFGLSAIDKPTLIVEGKMLSDAEKLRHFAFLKDVI